MKGTQRRGWVGRLFAAAIPLVSVMQLSAQETAVPPFDSATFIEHVRHLASDSLQGRGTGSRHATLAARYIADACRRYGLHPVSGRYRHAFPLVAVRVDSLTARARVQVGDRQVSLRTPDDFIPDLLARHAARSFDGHLVYAGPIDSVQARLAGAPSLSGRVVVTVGAPGRRPDLGDSLLIRGATGLVVLVGGADAFDAYRRARGPQRFMHSGPVSSALLLNLPTIVAGPRLTAEVLANLSADGSAPRLWAPSDLRLSMRWIARPQPVPADNVACVAPGSDSSLRTRFIAYAAHYDHLGVASPAIDGDSIYNGFSDNAAGVSLLLGLARAFRLEPARHSTLFLFFSGEEQGLLGSDHWVATPPIPLAAMVALINLDAGAPPAIPTKWNLQGGRDSGLGSLAVEVAAGMGAEGRLEPATPNSDHYPFARHGVPAVFPVPAPAPFRGHSALESRALSARWDRYHRLDDEFDPTYPLAGLMSFAHYAHRLGRRLDIALDFELRD